MTRFIVGAALFAGLAMAAQAQTASTGDTIRVEHRSGAVTEGVLLSRDASSLEVRPLDGQAATRIARSDIAEAQMRMGTRRRGWQPVGIGALTGGVIGAVGGFSGGNDPKGQILAFTAGEKASILGLFGMAVGSVVGAFFAPTQVTNWIPLDPSAFAAAPVPASIGVALGLTSSASLVP